MPMFTLWVQISFTCSQNLERLACNSYTYKPRILTFRFFQGHIPGSWNYYALYQEVPIEQVQAQHESTNLVEVSD